MRHQQVFGLAAIDGVAKAPAAGHLAAALGLMSVEATVALATGRDGADDDALPH